MDEHVDHVLAALQGIAERAVRQQVKFVDPREPCPIPDAAGPFREFARLAHAQPEQMMQPCPCEPGGRFLNVLARQVFEGQSEGVRHLFQGTLQISL